MAWRETGSIASSGANMDGTLDDLADAQGGAERIKKHTDAEAVRYFLCSSLHMYCLLLPLGWFLNMGCTRRWDLRWWGSSFWLWIRWPRSGKIRSITPLRCATDVDLEDDRDNLRSCLVKRSYPILRCPLLESSVGE